MEMMSLGAKKPIVQKYCFGKKFDDKFLSDFHKHLEVLTGRKFSVTHENAGSISDSYWFNDTSDCDEPLEFRMSLCDNRVTVSRVCLWPRRVGVFTTLIEHIVSWSCNNDVEYITIQSVSTPEMVLWCRKNDYVLRDSTGFEAGGFLFGDYTFTLR